MGTSRMCVYERVSASPLISKLVGTLFARLTLEMQKSAGVT